MYELKNINNLLLSYYIDTINNFIGGEKALVIDDISTIDKETLKFFQRLTTAIYDNTCGRKCPLRKKGIYNE